MLASSTFCTTSMTVMTCPACPSVPSNRAPTSWTASYPVPPKRKYSPSSWWSRLPSASSCASARWFISSSKGFKNLWDGRLRQTGRCSQRRMRWLHWQRPGPQPEWIPQHLSRTLVMSELKKYLWKHNLSSLQLWQLNKNGLMTWKTT